MSDPVPPMPESNQPIIILENDPTPGSGARSQSGRAAKWTGWMDQALVRQVLATDPLNCARGRTVAKWAEVAGILQTLEPQPIFRSAESCRQRVKKLVEIFKVSKAITQLEVWK